MNTGIIASRYADALLKYVKETGEGEIVYKQAEILENAMRSIPELVRFLESQTLFNTSGKLALVQKVLGEDKLCESLSRFLKLVISHDRVVYLPYILHYYRERWCSVQGVSLAKLTVSAPSQELEKRICAMFKDYTGKRLELKTTVDPDLIGGFVFEVADRRIDASISRQMAELKRQFISGNDRLV